MDERLIATSAVRCVGNVLLLHGRTWSPPFVVTAIGDADAIRAPLAASPQVQLFQQAVEDYGLGFGAQEGGHPTLTAYDRRAAMECAPAAAGCGLVQEKDPVL